MKIKIKDKTAHLHVGETKGTYNLETGVLSLQKSGTGIFKGKVSKRMTVSKFVEFVGGVCG